VGQRVSDVRVVIVDDQEIYRSALTGLLDIAGGYRVVAEAGSGEEALELVAAHAPDLVFLDLRLPGIDGTAVAAEIRSADRGPLVVLISTDVEALRSDAVQGSGAFGTRAKADLDLPWLEALRSQVRQARPRR
jgi:DNA-binding NarL/FixJ family response regulator